MKLKTSKQLVQEAMDKIKTISPSELKDLQKKKPDLILIDIRDIRELKKTGKIVNIQEKDKVDTIGGLVFVLAERVPGRGEVINHTSGIEFSVVEVDARRIKKLLVQFK